MSVRETLQIGHPALKVLCQPVSNFNDPHVQQIIDDLTDTMRENQLIGMAAPQIGEGYQIFVTEPRETKTRPKDQSDELRVYINPVITQFSDEQIIIYEGCGSVLRGQLFGPVPRPKTITLEAFDRTGRKFRFTADGILGRVIQHEHDHLHGIEFLEKVSDYKKMMVADYYIQNIKNDPDHMAASKISIMKLEEMP